MHVGDGDDPVCEANIGAWVWVGQTCCSCGVRHWLAWLGWQVELLSLAVNICADMFVDVVPHCRVLEHLIKIIIMILHLKK